MAKKKPRKIYKVIQKEIVIDYDHQPVSSAQSEKIIKKEFPNCPQKKIADND